MKQLLKYWTGNLVGNICKLDSVLCYKQSVRLKQCLIQSSYLTVELTAAL